MNAAQKQLRDRVWGARFIKSVNVTWRARSANEGRREATNGRAGGSENEPLWALLARHYTLPKITIPLHSIKRSIIETQRDWRWTRQANNKGVAFHFTTVQPNNNYAKSDTVKYNINPRTWLIWKPLAIFDFIMFPVSGKFQPAYL